MAFQLKPNMRALCGHVYSASNIALRKAADVALRDNATGEVVDNGEAVTVIAKPDGPFVLISRQDGVQGFIKVEHLHVQAWPSAPQARLAAGWEHVFVWQAAPAAASTPLTQPGASWKLSALAAPGEYSWQPADGAAQGNSCPVRALTSHVLLLFDGTSQLLLLLHEPVASGSSPFLLLWDGAEARGIAHVSGQAANAPPPVLCAGWEGVWTWSNHEDEQRVGAQFAVTALGQYRRRVAEPQPLLALTSHAWCGANDGRRVFCLSEPDGACVVWRQDRAVLPPSATQPPSMPHACVAWHMPAQVTDRFRLTVGRDVLCGNTSHNGGGTLLRREPREALDEANNSGVQVFDGDVVRVVEMAARGWCRVTKAGVGEGWIFTRNLHAQARDCAAGEALGLPHVSGIAQLAVPLPADWAAQSSNLALIALEPGSTLWAETEARLRKTVPSASLVRIEQIQNIRLWQRFFTERALMASDHGAAPREEEMFHGTGATPPHCIYNGQEGFDMRFCTQGMWGIANYFAVEAGYSNTDKYCHKNDGGERELLLAQVLIGRCFESPPNSEMRMPPELPKGGGRRYDSVAGVGGGGGQSRVVMVYANGRAYPKLRLTYTTDRDRPKSPTPKPTDYKQLPAPPAANAAAVDKFALYLRPSARKQHTGPWQAILSAAAREQAGWGGLHVTLCSFSPKLSSGFAGHHGGSLKQTALAIHQAVLQRNAGKSPTGRWQLDKRWSPANKMEWVTRGGLVMVGLAGHTSGSLKLVASAVHQAGMVNPRGRGDLHMTLGPCSSLPPPPPPHTYPAERAPAVQLPEELVDALCMLEWAVAVVKLTAGQQPAVDNESFTI